MTPLEMIAEWRKGCTNTIEVDGYQWRRPEKCLQCTRELIDALEAKLRAGMPPEHKGEA